MSVPEALAWAALAIAAAALVGAVVYLAARSGGRWRGAHARRAVHGSGTGSADPVSAAGAEDAPNDTLSALGERRVRSMLTPRRELDWIDLDASAVEQRERLLRARHSRLPVGRGSVDRLLGIVHVRDVLDRSLRNEPVDVAACLREPLVVPESLPGRLLLERFRERGERFAVALDEYGGVEGVVCVTDVMEALLGELPAAASGPTPTVEREPDGAYLLDGKLYVEELKGLLAVAALPREEDRVYRTLGGLVVTLLGRIPEVGDAVDVDGHRLEVVAMDGPRVGRVRAAGSDAASNSVEA